jgi:hypothetical protein
MTTAEYLRWRLYQRIQAAAMAWQRKFGYSWTGHKIIRWSHRKAEGIYG